MNKVLLTIWNTTTLVICLLLSAIPVVFVVYAFYTSFFDRHSGRNTEWVDWKSNDGNARIVTCRENFVLSETGPDFYRPATEEELYKYKEEFPRSVPGFVYAGASLFYGEDPKTKEKVPYVTGYAVCGYGFFPSLEKLHSLEQDNLQLVIKKGVPIQGRLEYYLGQPEKIGPYDIPRRTKP